MDNETLRLIARLKITAARAGLPVDVVRFAADRPYARSVLQKVSDSASEEDVLLALLLMEKLRMIAPVPPEVAAPPSRPGCFTRSPPCIHDLPLRAAAIACTWPKPLWTAGATRVGAAPARPHRSSVHRCLRASAAPVSRNLARAIWLARASPQIPRP
ncbi:MAG: hypothetical protein ACK54L_18655 [Betaproteobacteria bacterium]